MLYVLGLITALQIIVAQTLWKIGLEKANFVPTIEHIFSQRLISTLLSPLILLGVVLYFTATITFFILLSKFDYSNAQTVVVVSSLTLIFLSAVLIFNETLNIVNVLGILFLFAGVLLITQF